MASDSNANTDISSSSAKLDNSIGRRRAGLSSPSEAYATKEPAFKQHVSTDTGWVQSLRHSAAKDSNSHVKGSHSSSRPRWSSATKVRHNNHTPSLSDSHGTPAWNSAKKNNKDRRQLQSSKPKSNQKKRNINNSNDDDDDQLTDFDRRLLAVDTNQSHTNDRAKKSKSWNESLHNLLQMSDTTPSTTLTSSSNNNTSSTPKALEDFDMQEYQQFASSMDNTKNATPLRKYNDTTISSSSSDTSASSRPSLSRRAKHHSSTSPSTVLPGVDIINGVGTNSARNVTFSAARGTSSVFDNAVSVLKGGSPSLTPKLHLKPSNTADFVKRLSSNNPSNDTPLDTTSPRNNGSNTSNNASTSANRNTVRPLLTSSPPKSHSNPYRGLDLFRRTPSSSSKPRITSINTAPYNNNRSRSASTSPKVVSNISDANDDDAAVDTPTAVALKVLRGAAANNPSTNSNGNSLAVTSTTRSSSPDSPPAVFEAPNFFGGRAEPNQRKDGPGNGNGNSRGGNPAANLMRSLENARALLLAATPGRSNGSGNDGKGSARSPRQLMKSTAEREQEQRLTNSLMIAKQPDSSNRPWRAWSPNSSKNNSKAVDIVVRSNPSGSSGSQYRDRRVEAAEANKFHKRFVPPHFSKAVDAAHSRRTKTAQATLLNSDLTDNTPSPTGKRTTGIHSGSADFLYANPTVYAMDPDRTTDQRDPVGHSLMQRSMKLAHSNLRLDKDMVPTRREPSEDGSPQRRGIPLRSSPHQFKFGHDETMFEPATQRHYRQQASTLTKQKPPATACSPKKLHPPAGRHQFHSNQNSLRSPDDSTTSAPASTGARGLQQRTKELDRMAKKLEQDRRRLEKEREQIFELQKRQQQLPPPPTSAPHGRSRGSTNFLPVHGLERSVPTAHNKGLDSLYVGGASTLSYQDNAFPDDHGNSHNNNTYMTPEELNVELQRSARKLHDDFDWSVQRMKAKVGVHGEAPLSQAAVDTIKEASLSNDNNNNHDTATAPANNDFDFSAAKDLEETLREVSARRQRRIEMLRSQSGLRTK